MLLSRGNMLHAEYATGKYCDYIYERITENCLSNLPVEVSAQGRRLKGNNSGVYTTFSQKNIKILLGTRKENSAL